MPKYQQYGGSWYLCYVDNGDTTGTWYFTTNSNCTPVTDAYEGDVGELELPSAATFTATGSATGSPSLACCTDCSTCSECPSSKTISVSGLTGYCDIFNATFTPAKTTNGDGTCYYYDEQYPSGYECVIIWVNLTCDCDVWYLEIGGTSCDPETNLEEIAWMSEPRTAVFGCPPQGTYTMHIVQEGCSPTGQVPTVSIS